MTSANKDLFLKLQQVIKGAQNILLTCHINPDEDSVGSVLALMHFLMSQGKKVTAIAGDTAWSGQYDCLPGAELIIKKSLIEIEVDDIDLFIITDCSSLDRVSGLPVGQEKIKQLNTFVIDHHLSNDKFGDFNLVIPDSSATVQIIYDFFEFIGWSPTKEVAICLLVGLYGDTMNFVTQSTSAKTLKTASVLASLEPDFQKYLTLVFKRQPIDIIFQGLALSKVETFFDDRVAIATINLSDLEKKNIPSELAGAGQIAYLLSSVKGWEIGACLMEEADGETKVSLRSQNSDEFNLVELAKQLGGGGHPGAGGAVLPYSPAEAKEKLLVEIKNYFPI